MYLKKRHFEEREKGVDEVKKLNSDRQAMVNYLDSRIEILNKELTHFTKKLSQANDAKQSECRAGQKHRLK